MASCCRQLSNSTVQFIPECFSWCNLEAVVKAHESSSRAHNSTRLLNMPSIFRHCLNDFDSSQDEPDVACDAAPVVIWPHSTTTSSPVFFDPTERATLRPTPVYLNAAAHAAGLNGTISAVLLTVLLIAGLLSSGALAFSCRSTSSGLRTRMPCESSLGNRR
jgi:hypothetical protein